MNGEAEKLPGALEGKALLGRILRVDHAGEYGALRIYEGQLAALKNSPSARVIAHMKEQEKEHLAAFEALMREHRARPTALLPVWHVGGFLLGAATAALGEEAAMACTVAVEEVIGEHYSRQRAALGREEPELAATLEKFRADEMEHHATGLAHGAEDAPAYPILRGLVGGVTRAAIWLSERV